MGSEAQDAKLVPKGFLGFEGDSHSVVRALHSKGTESESKSLPWRSSWLYYLYGTSPKNAVVFFLVGVGPHNKDYSILGFYIGVPEVLGNKHVFFSALCQIPTPVYHKFGQLRFPHQTYFEDLNLVFRALACKSWANLIHAR